MVTEGTLRFDNVELPLSGRDDRDVLTGISFEAQARRDHRHCRPAGQRQVDASRT